MFKKVFSCLLSIFVLFSIVNTGPVVTTYAQVIELEDDNLGFESNLAGWNVNGNITIQSTGGKAGNSALMRSGSTLSKTIFGVPQGSYTISMWVKGSSSSNSATLSIKDTGGPDSVLRIDAQLDSNTWRQIAHRNVLVYNGQMSIHVNAGTSSGLQIDEIAITLDSNDNNPVQNWDFEGGLDGWEAVGNVTNDTAHADTGLQAVKLADQSEISQRITVKPNTDYVATVRMKVDEQDTYKSTKQYSLDETAVFGLLVERESLGNRVNLGVRGLDGVVLRQAPASTEGYALVTIAFRTGANQTEVELYANTIYDQNYINSVAVYENKQVDNPFPNGWQRPNPEEMDNTHPADEWASNGNQFSYVDNFNLFEMNNDYIKGVDMAFLQPIEDAGGKYFANGVQQDALRILSNHGVNSILTPLWVKAGNPVYDWNTLTPLSTQTVGYDGEAVTGRQLIPGYFGKRHSVAIGKRATELNMTYTPSFHYSDSWISAAKAHMPYEWIEKDYEGKLSNPDIHMLETAVYNYVYDALSEMRSEGINIISVKHGNEQDGGLLFPVASGSKFTEHAAIITASTRATNEIYPGAINTIHTNTGYNPAQISSFFQAFANRGAEFDGMAFSLYGGRETTGQFVMMNAAMQNDATKYYDYINVETGFTFTRDTPIGDTESTMALTQYYSATPNGQYNFLLDYMQAPLDIPNPHGTTRGFYYWNAEVIPIYGVGHKAGEVAGGSKRILFNNGTAGIREMGSSYEGKAGDMMDSMYAFLHRGYTKEASDTLYNPLRHNGTNYDVGEATSVSFQDDSLSLKVGEVTRLQPTIAPTNQLLKDYTIRYTSNHPNVVEVSPYGFVTGISPGSATITATIGNVSTTVAVTINEADVASELTITYEVIRNRSSVGAGTFTAGDTLEVKPYDKVKLKSTVSGNPTNKAVVYTVSNPEIAWWYGDTSETNDEVIRTLSDRLSTSNYEPIVQLNPVKGGTVQVTANSGDGATEVSFNVAVTQTDVTAITINEGDSTIRAGRSLQLTSTITPTDASFYKVNWSSEDESIASVDANGLVTALAPGITTITITSHANPTITNSITITVTDVLVEELLLSSNKIGLLIGDSKTLVSMALPDNAVNKAVVWSVQPGDEDIIEVDQNGVVTGLQPGTATVVVSSADGGLVTATCVVTVVEEAIASTNMELLENQIWITSNYFSHDHSIRGDSKPVVKLETIFTPEETTNTDVIWSSNNTTVASVDTSGIVTAHKAGVAVITAQSVEGGFIDSATIYVPNLSDDWENYEVGSKGGFTDGNTFTYEVVGTAGEQKLQAAVRSQRGGENPPTLNRKVFTPVSGDEVVVDFDWNVGSFTPDNRSRGAHLSIEDANGNTYLALATYPAISGNDYEMTYYILNGSTAMPTRNGSVNGNFNYIHGGGGAGGTYSDTADVGVGLKGANKEYQVRVVLDFKNREISFSVTDKVDPTITSTVSGLAMDARVNYSNSFGAIAFSHYFNSLASWTTSIDNLAVYTPSIKAERIDYHVEAINMNQSEGIKLVPVEAALSSTAKINASVIPASADQQILFTPLGELADILSIDAGGVITVNSDSLVEYGSYDEIQSTTGFIRVSSLQTPEIYSDIRITIGSPNASEVIQVYVDGEEYLEPITLPVGSTPTLTFTATGGDGVSDLYAYDWQVASGHAVIDGNGKLTALSAGEVIVTFTVDFFRKEEVRTLEIRFEDNLPTFAITYDANGATGTPPVESAKAEGETFIAAESNDLTAPEGMSFKEWNTASDGSGAAYAAGATVTMPTEDLTLYAIWVVAEPIHVTGVSITPTSLTLEAGKSLRLTAVVYPENADNTKVSWSSSDETIAVVDETGLVTALKPGTAMINAITEDGEFTAESEVSVTNLLSQGKLVTASGAVTSYPAENAVDGNPESSWSTGGNHPGSTLTVDLGEIALIESTLLTSWTPQDYKIEVSEDGIFFTTVVERSDIVSTPWPESRVTTTDLMPSEAYARYVRLTVTNIKEGQWLGVREFEVYGSYGEPVEGPKPDPVIVESLSVTPATIELEVGETQAFSVTANYSNATTAEITTEASYSTNNEAVATVNEAGVITAIAVGIATIKVVLDEVSAEVEVTVTEEADQDPSEDDTEAPIWREDSTLTAAKTTSGSVTLTWNVAIDNLAVTAYKVTTSRKGTVVKTEDVEGDLTSVVIRGLQSNTSYTFTLIATDEAGNMSSELEVSVTTARHIPPAEPQPTEPQPIEPEQPVEPQQPVEPEQPAEPQQPRVEFTDLPENHWAASAIKRAAALGIVQGHPDGSFKPTEPTTRAQFITMLANAFKWNDEQDYEAAQEAQSAQSAQVDHTEQSEQAEQSNQPKQSELSFKDSDKIGAWAKDAITQGIERGIITGYTDGSFRPNQEITRTEMIVMLTRALGIAQFEIESTNFADDAAIPAWGKGAVESLRQQGLITGRGGNSFAPNEAATRAEALVIIMRALELN